jgi:hypothetical protein
MDLYDTVREIVAGQGSRFTTVEFVKKDGTLRTMLVQHAATKFRVKGDAASESAQRATATRAAAHPNLLNIYDVDRGAIRSIDMNTVLTVKSGGRVLFRNPLAVVNWFHTRARA